MALFKIYKGDDSARLTNPSNPNYLPKVDGYCYFDTSTGLFYIDARTGGTDQNPIITRAPLNALKATQDIDGNRIDATYLKKSIGTTKGDIVYWDGKGTPVRLGAGSNGQVLKIANGIPTWAADNNTNTAHTTFTWTNGNIAGPTGSLSGNHTAVSFGAIPSASSSTSGIITTATQNIAGIKTFDNDIVIKGGLNNYFTCTGTAATTKIVNNATNYVPALWKCDSTITVQDGAMITIKMPTAGHDYGVWLSVDNGTTYKPIAQTMQGTGRLTTHFPANSLLTLVYDSNHRSDSMCPIAGGTSRSNITGSWVVVNGYNSDSIETYTEYAGETTGSVGLKANAILLRTAANRWDSVVTSSKIATDKARNTTGFIIGSKIWWTNYNVAANTALHSSWCSIYSFKRRMDFRYSSNCGTTLTPGKPVYLVGTVTNGYFYLDATWWTQTIPTTEDGKVYVLVGGAYNNYQVDLYENNEWYWFKNNAFTLYSTNVDTAVNADKLDGKHLNEIAAGKTTTLSWNTESTIATIGGNAIKVKLPSNPNTDTGATSVEVTGTGNAITGASYDASTRTLTLTKNYSLPIATASALGGVKSSTTGKTANRDYVVEVKSDGTMKVNVPWTDHTYSLAGLVGSTAIGKASLPIYWNGSKFTTITSYEGNADTATKFASAQNIKLTGAITGEKSSQAGWEIATTLTDGIVATAKIADKAVTNAKLANSSITINGKSVSLGGSLSLADIGLGSALRFIGVTSTAIVDGTADNKVVINGSTVTATTGDVVINTNNDKEYVWLGSAWEILGDESSYEVKGVAQNLINSQPTDVVLGESTTFTNSTSSVSFGTHTTKSVIGSNATFTVTNPTISINQTKANVKATASGAAVSLTTGSAITALGSPTSSSFVTSYPGVTGKLVTTTIKGVAGTTSVSAISSNTEVTATKISSYGTAAKLESTYTEASETLVISWTANTVASGSNVTATKTVYSNTSVATANSSATTVATGGVTTSGTGGTVLTGLGTATTKSALTGLGTPTTSTFATGVSSITQPTIKLTTVDSAESGVTVSVMTAASATASGGAVAFKSKDNVSAITALGAATAAAQKITVGSNDKVSVVIKT